MDFEQQELLNEICWIVNQRNVWARKRQHHRNKLNRSRLKLESFKHFSQPEYSLLIDSQTKLHNELKAAFDSANAERSKLIKFTKRLKFLLKQIDANLVSDANAGYSAVEIRKQIDAAAEGTIAGAQSNRYKISSHVNRDEISDRALVHETNLAISNMLK